MDNILHYEKWKLYQKQYAKKNRTRMSNYAREYYHRNKSRFKIYYEKYKKQKIDGTVDNKITNKYQRLLLRENNNTEKLLEKARLFREELRTAGYPEEFLGTF
jgi:hypothetical protein